MGSRLYENCPTVQAASLLAFCGAVFVPRAFESLSFDLPQILQHGEVYRIFASSFVFKDMGQTFYGLVLLYSCRHFERLLGVRKFGAFCCVTYAASIALHLSSTTILNLSLGSEYVPASGPYFLVYGLLALYHAHIPRVHPSQYTLLGSVVFSEKTWIYLLALHLALCMGTQSLLPAASGLAVGHLYARDWLALQSWRLPVAVERVMGVVASFVSNLIPTTTGGPPTMRGGVAGGARGIPPGAPGAFPSAPPMGHAEPPPEEAISQLCSTLGVERPAAIEALQVTGNNVDAAANFLLR